VDYQDCGNGIRTDLDYNERGFTKLTNSFRLSPSQPYTRRDYWRDNRDRIVWWKKAETGRGDRYSYDAEGQLTRASYQAATPELTPSGALRSDIFKYDELGNRMGSNYVASRGAWMDFTRKDNGLNQYSGWWPYCFIKYDDDIGGTWGAPHAANGVQMQDGNTTAGFNALNQPTMIWADNVGGWTYFGYDPLGRCVKRWIGSSSMAASNPATYLYYDGWNLVQEGSSASSAGRLYVHGGRVDEIVASLTLGAWNYHHYDARGHCILLTGPSGNVIEQYEYDAFGKPYFYNAGGGVLPNGSSYGNRFLFTGREWLKDLKLYDYRARMYQPELGRFLQPDPKQFAAGDYNLYRYCHNDPVNKSDPTGLLQETYDYPDPKQAAAMRALINRILARNDEWSANVQKMRASPFPFKFIPVQTTTKGLDKYSLSPHTENPPGNRTSPFNDPNSYNHTGSGSTVELDPTNRNSPSGDRDPIIAAVHEIAGHVVFNMHGTRLHGTAEEMRARKIEMRFREDLKKKP
jgi:RHS repeat-associated protein